MTTTLTADALPQLAERINQEHRACEAALNTGLQHALEAGRLLIEAKKEVGHGEWVAWVDANCEFSKRTSQAYMRVSRQYPRLDGKAQRVALLTFRGAVASLASNSTALANAAEDVQEEALAAWEEKGCKNSHQAIHQGEMAISQRRFDAEMEAKRAERLKAPVAATPLDDADDPDDDDLDVDPVDEMLGSFVESVQQLLQQAYETAGDALERHPAHRWFEQIEIAVGALANPRAVACGEVAIMEKSE